MKTLPLNQIEVQIRHTDIDILGHIAHSKYAEFLELGRLHWFRSIPGEAIGAAATVTTTINFKGEVQMDDRVSVKTWCTKKGNTSITLAQEVYANDRVVTDSTSVVVGFDLESRKAVPFLSDWQPTAIE